MIDINSKVEKFCADYDLPVDQMDHPNSILCADGTRAFVSDNEIELMERIVAAEARGEAGLLPEDGGYREGRSPGIHHPPDGRHLQEQRLPR